MEEERPLGVLNLMRDEEVSKLLRPRQRLIPSDGVRSRLLVHSD